MSNIINNTIDSSLEFDALNGEIKDNNLHEIAPNVISERMDAFYQNGSYLLEQPRTIYRLNVKGRRYYYCLNDNNQIDFFNSTTEFLKMAKGEDEFLVKWKLKVGERKANEIMLERSHYGTFLHIQAQELLISRKLNLDDLHLALRGYMVANYLDDRFMNNLEDLKDDLLSFAQFMIDRKVEPIAIELVLANEATGTAGAIDIVAWMDWQGKRIKALIDIKSRRDGFFEDHILQLGDYRDNWNYNFPNDTIEYIFNWSPKNWRGNKPTYNLANQTDNKVLEKLPYLRKLVAIDDAISNKLEKAIYYASGVIDLDKVDSLQDNIKELNLEAKLLNNLGVEVNTHAYNKNSLDKLKIAELIELISELDMNLLLQARTTEIGRNLKKAELIELILNEQQNEK